MLLLTTKLPEPPQALVAAIHSHFCPDCAASDSCANANCGLPVFRVCGCYEWKIGR